MAILDEIQRLVPGYDVSRMNLLAGNSEHTSLDKSGPGAAQKPESIVPANGRPVHVRHAGTLFACTEVCHGKSRSQTCRSRGGLIS